MATRQSPRKARTQASTVVPLPARVAAAPRRLPVTSEQQAWLNTHRNYTRISGRLKAFQARGTLWPDGTFIPERGITPVTVGNGAIGVGIPAPVRPRRRR